MIKTNKAFSILELIIAIFVIAVGLLAVYGVTQKILSETIVSVSRLEATYLAQEGLEIVRNIRDSNVISGNGWNTGFDLCDPAQNYFCEVDYDGPVLISRNNDEDSTYLRFENSFYNYDSGDNTRFQRKIFIESVEDNKADILIEVIWEEKGEEHNFLLNTSLYDWR